MKVHHLNTLEPRPFKKAVLTIGTFDGVHIGHKKILERVKMEARRIGGESVLITFHPHPRNVLRPEGPSIGMINTIDEKIQLLDGIGIDHLIIVPFTPAFAQLTARQYVEEFIIEKFHPHTLIIGYDHHFGSGRAGNFQLLETYREKGAFHLLEIEAALLKESQVSSTRIREALHQGDVEEAAALLGYPFYFTATVVEGQHLGRTIGFPTANLAIEDPEKIIAGNGVYAVGAQLTETADNSSDQPIYSGMMNIGFRPTVHGTQRTLEVHLLDFREMIYGKKLRVTLHYFLRAERKFDGLEQLQKQLQLDALRSREILQNLPMAK